MAPKSEAPKSTIPEQYRGTKSYRLTQAHYRLGRYFNPGELITVTDEVPGKSWVPVEAKATVEYVESQPKKSAGVPQV